MRGFIRWLPLLLMSAATICWAGAGTITDTSGPIGYDAGPFIGANQSPIFQVDTGPRCTDPAFPCDAYELTVTLPPGYASAHPNGAVRLTVSWTDTGSTQSDYDLYVFPPATPVDGAHEADFQAVKFGSPDSTTISPLHDGTKVYSLRLLPVQPTGETVHVAIELLPGSGSAPGAFGGEDPATPGVPRYQNFIPPINSSGESGAGEFNIGFNPHTGRIMAMNTGPILRITPAEVRDPPSVTSPGAPESCEATWEDKSSGVTEIGLDPILWTDQKIGRTFASNSTVGANAVYAYSDDDGDNWIPIGAGPPSGGADHETIGTGPFPPGSSLANTVNHGINTIYCSQDIVGPAMCQRSLDLGASWGPGVPAYTGSGTEGCGGLHGHARFSPNGTIWLPTKDCNDRQGGVTSTDAGLTWKEFVVSGSRSQSSGADPSVAIDSENTAYYCYVNNEPVPAGSAPEGHVHVKVSHDGGATWINDVDVGLSHGIKNAVHPEAVAGSAGRAACGFIGSNLVGDYQGMGYQGDWYAFIATTYDGGAHWVTVNATPNDPVQHRSGVWQGGGAHTDRNLLDFNEITMDDRGRVLYGYSDGCVSNGCMARTQSNDFVAHMRVARQSGGRTLLAANDPVEPARPKRACVSATRDELASYLTWKIPDHGGSAIDHYEVWRGLAPGAETLLATTNATKNAYVDTSADPDVASYYYAVKAVNALGASALSNEVHPPLVVLPHESACSAPGITQLTDPSGDSTAALVGPGTDLYSFHIVQPYQPGVADADLKLYFVLDTDAGQSPQPPNTAWYVAMKIADPPPAETFHYRAVHLAWDTNQVPIFESYEPSTNLSGGTDGRFVLAGSTKPADGSYAAPFDQVVIAPKLKDLGLAPGDRLVGFVSAVSLNAVRATELIDQMPDSLDFKGSYTIASNQACRPNTPPVVSMSANPTAGASPLSVHFTASATDADTDAPADTIARYTFDFGDGSARVSQASGAIDHVYNGANSYIASAKATDSRGADSENAANVVIVVSAPSRPTDLSIAKSHMGNFSVGQVGATYTIAVRNDGDVASHGTVTVVDTLPSGLTANGMSGSGWSCATKPKPQCTRADALAGGAAYPPITVTVSVGRKAAGTVTNYATVSGGGDSNNSNNTAQDLTTVRNSP